jgi:SAM-dependent methyltransferase
VEREEILARKQELIDRHGAWTAHNIRLADGLYTIGERIIGDEIKLRRVTQIVADVAAKPFHELRVLDLACLEGLYAIEFARLGAEVVAIEGREANLAKARFAGEVFSLGNVSFIRDDVRNLSVGKYGVFDVVLCLGILYHLDAPDLFSFVHNISAVCRRLTVIDTHISPRPSVCREYHGKKYYGRPYREHAPSATSEAREKAAWASLDNPRSFWFTRPSLFNLLAQTGFSSAYECVLPEEAHKPSDRITVAAIKGSRRELISCPLVNAEAWEEVSEKSEGFFRRHRFGALHAAAGFLPEKLKTIIRKLLHV